MEMIFKLSHTNLGHYVLTNRNDTPRCDMFNTFSVTLTMKLQACVLSEINTVVSLRMSRYPTSPYQDPDPDKNRTC